MHQILLKIKKISEKLISKKCANTGPIDDRDETQPTTNSEIYNTDSYVEFVKFLHNHLSDTRLDHAIFRTLVPNRLSQVD